jgi:hypothetical protein
MMRPKFVREVTVTPLLTNNSTVINLLIGHSCPLIHITITNCKQDRWSREYDHKEYGNNNSKSDVAYLIISALKPELKQQLYTVNISLISRVVDVSTVLQNLLFY